MSRSLIPNSTQIPDVILDHWMAELSGAEFKVLLYIARRTYGFGKDSDTISLTQIASGIVRRDGTVLDRGTGASKSSVARCLKELEDRGLIIKITNLAPSGREFEENTYKINLDWVSPQTSGGTPNTENGTGEGVVPKSDYLVSPRDHVVPKGEQGWSQNRTRVVPKSDIQETDQQETDQKTAAAEEPAAAELIRLLVGNGMGRSKAIRFAKEKPDLCRRYLAWLPYASIRTTPGSWLANAIEHEYGPPRGVSMPKSTPNPDEQSGRPQKAPQQGRQAADKRWVRHTHAQLSQSHPEAMRAFSEFFASERQQAIQFATRLTKEGQAKFLESTDSEEYRLNSFERWLKGEGKSFQQADASPTCFAELGP